MKKLELNFFHSLFDASFVVLVIKQRRKMSLANDEINLNSTSNKKRCLSLSTLRIFGDDDCYQIYLLIDIIYN